MRRSALLPPPAGMHADPDWGNGVAWVLIPEISLKALRRAAAALFSTGGSISLRPASFTETSIQDSCSSRRMSDAPAAKAKRTSSTATSRGVLP